MLSLLYTRRFKFYHLPGIDNAVKFTDFIEHLFGRG